MDGEASLCARLAGPAEERAAALRAAAEGGAVEAQLLVGQTLLDTGAARDGLGWFVRAAQAGDARAMNMVGRCFEQGWGTPRDARQAVAWFEASAARGHDWGLYNLATQLTLGEGAAEDRPCALALFRQAAALGHAKSMTMIGGFHEDGWVVPRDLALAADWYARGADGGDFRGCFNHARLLIAAGRLPAAVRRLRAMRDTATPAFLGKADAWLRGHPDPNVRELLDFQGRNDFISPVAV